MDMTFNLPPNTNEWTKEDVRNWVTKCPGIGQDEGDILYKENITGRALNLLTREDFSNMNIAYGSAKIILHEWTQITKAREKNQAVHDKKNSDKKVEGQKTIPKRKDEMQKEGDATKLDEEELPLSITETQSCTNVDLSCPRVTCLPYPFDCTHETKRYTQHHFLLPESGPSNYIDPVHEYKEFTNTEKATEEDKKMKFCNEVFRFATACMNARTNGTIHFGVRDKPHGEIIGVNVADREFYSKHFYQMMSKYFEENQYSQAKQCIRPPRYVSVLYPDNTLTDLAVIEVDVVPEYKYCVNEAFHSFQYKYEKEKWIKSNERCCFVRDGDSSKDILANVKHKDADFKTFYSQMKDRDDSRRRAEENVKIKEIQKVDHGSKLVSLITGNQDTLDNSYYKRYILVANKSHESHTEHLEFLYELPWFSVIDFDPNSCRNGLCKFYREKRVANLHSPHQFQFMDNLTPEKIEELKLFQQTSWIFCNGRVDIDSVEYKPLDNKLWLKNKASEVRKLVSFLCRKDVMQPGKFLVVFLLLSSVEDEMDPINYIFSAFFQDLNGMKDILCICESEQTFHRWKDLHTKCIAEDALEEASVYNLDLKSINGTILKLKSSTRSSSRFLPSQGGSSTILSRKDEDLMASLDILCINECQDTELEKIESKFKELMKVQEEKFYRGGKATWWNFYFASEKYTGPFIKRDNYEKLKHLIESSSTDTKTSVKIVTLFHHPGCGGTTTAMHILWELRNTFRCATLKRKSDNFADTAKDIISLATLGSANVTDYYPTLLLVDDFEEEDIHSLQNCIRSAITERSIRYERTVVVILYCVRSQNPEETSKTYCTKSVALKHELSEQEKRAFEMKLKEMEKHHQKPEDFYSFMILKTNFNVKYVENVTRNMLKGLNIASKEAQLISFLALLNKFVNDSTISHSMCEEFLGMTIRPLARHWAPETIEEKLGPHSAIILRSDVEEYGYEGLRIIHPMIAKQCIKEFKNSHDMKQSTIMLNILQTNTFYDSRIGRDILSNYLQSMLVTRHRKEHGDDTDTFFSPLVEEIEKDEGHESVEKVLKEGAIRFNQNPYILQALSRHFYIRKKDIDSAFKWAQKAKQISPNNSFILNTIGQIYKTQLKMMIKKQGKTSPRAADLRVLLTTAENASRSFKECQEQTEKIESERDEYDWAKPKGYNVYNTAGYSGQIDVCLNTVEILFLLPWFNNRDFLSRQHLRQYLSGKWDISVDNQSESHEEICSVLQEFRHFLTRLKPCLKENFDFFDDYFVFFKQKSFKKETYEFKIREKVNDCYKKYSRLFCTTKLPMDYNVMQKKSISLHVQDCRICLESYKADRFSGILQYLNSREKDKKNLEIVVTIYRFLLDKSPDMCTQRDKQNFILANIVLHCVSPKSPNIAPIETLKNYLREVLQTIRFDHQSPDPYFLASLLFWPQDKYQLDSDSKIISKYIHAMRKSSKGYYRHMHCAKSPKAHFYLTKNKGLKRLIHKGRIDHNFSAIPTNDLNSLWQGGEIWKEAETKELLIRVKGRVEDDDIIVEYGSEDRVTIPVRPAYLGDIRSGKSIEQVSFYLGFSVSGPIAYDVEKF